MNLILDDLRENIFDIMNMPKPEPVLDPTREPTFLFNKIFTDNEIEGFEYDASLDQEYIMSHAWHKAVSPMIACELRRRKTSSPSSTPWTDYPDLYVCTPTVINELAAMIWGRFGDSWSKVYAALVASDYDALENYNMIQQETPNITHTHSASNDYETEHRIGSDITVTHNNVTNQDSVNAFNSNSPVDVGKNVMSGNTRTTGDRLNNYETDTMKGSLTDAETGTRDLTRHGNIGVTTSQQMLESELKLRRENTFRKILFESVDQILTVPYYIQGKSNSLLRYET